MSVTTNGTCAAHLAQFPQITARRATFAARAADESGAEFATLHIGGRRPFACDEFGAGGCGGPEGVPLNDTGPGEGAAFSQSRPERAAPGRVGGRPRGER